MPSGVITSVSNPRVQAARKLRRRSERDASGAFLVEGIKAVSDAIASGADLHALFVTPEAPGRLRSLAAGAGIEVLEVSERVLDQICDTTTPQGVAAVARGDSRAVADLAGADLVLVLGSVGDPGNAGTLLRSAWAAGAAGAVFTRGAVDAWHPKTVRAAAGALFGLRVVRGGDLPTVLGELRMHGLVVIGSDAAAPTTAYETDLTRPVAIVVGNEGWGLPPESAGHLDELVSIPMPGPAESLNAGIAGSLLLFEAARQRRAHSARAGDRP